MMHFDVDARHPVDQTDVPFAEVEGKPLLARVYRPKSAAHAPRVALVDVHGGAWTLFDRTMGERYGRALAASGAVVVAVDFRQGPAHPYPTACADVAAGVRWTRAHAAQLGIDPGSIGLIGASSGGQIALEVALKPGAPEHTGTLVRMPDGSFDRTPGRDEVSFVLALFPVSDPLARYRYVQSRRHDPPNLATGFHPEALIDAHVGYFGTEKAMDAAGIPRLLRMGEARSLPPVWIAQPELDDNVPVAMTRALVEAYREAGGSIECVVFPGQTHGFVHRESPASEDCLLGMRRFIADRAKQRA